MCQTAGGNVAGRPVDMQKYLSVIFMEAPELPLLEACTPHPASVGGVIGPREAEPRMVGREGEGPVFSQIFFL